MKSLAFLLSLILTINLASAVVVNFVEVSPIAPGEEGEIKIEIENNFDNDVKDVSLLLDFTGSPFIPVGTSEQSVDEIEEDEEEDFLFKFRASTNTVPGQYEISYTLSYEDPDDPKSRQGTIGVKVTANPDLDFSLTADNPVLNNQGRVSLKIINKGFFDARFVSVRVIPEGFTLLSDDEEYVGEVESDDFETANFDVVFTDTDAKLLAIVEYRNFENEKVIENIELPVTVYTQDEAIALGIIQQSPTVFYVAAVVVLIILIILWRWWRKRQRLKRSMKNREN